MINIKLIICILFFIFLNKLYASENNDPLLTEVIAGHNALCQSIRTFSAQVIAETEIPTKEILRKGKYWRVKDTARIQETLPDNGLIDFLLKTTDVRIVNRFDWVNDEPTRVGAIRKSGNEWKSWCDVWNEFVLEMRGPDAKTASYQTLVARAKKVDPCRKISWNSRPCIEVVFHEINDANEELTTTFIHDIGYNYFVVETIGTTSYDKNVKFQKKLSNFENFSSGIFFPSSCILQVEKNGKITSLQTTKLSQIKINTSIDNEQLNLPEIPDGTPLEDRVAGITGTIDSNWKWIEQTGKTKPPEVVAPRNPTHFEGPSIDEPTSFWSWAMLFGGGFFVVTGAILIYLKSRQ